MKIKLMSLIVSLAYLPLYLWFVWRILVEINASEVLFFVFWLMIPFAFFSAILSKLAEWEDD